MPYDRLIEETDASGTLIVDYLYLDGKPFAQIRKTGDTTEETYYYHTDHLGMPKAMTDKNGNVVWRVDFDPFGNEIGTPLMVVENYLRFPGQYFDQESGLHYNYFRDYDPRTGRYVEADPVGTEPDLDAIAEHSNPYIYSGSNPVIGLDPWGLVFITAEEARVIVAEARTWIKTPYESGGTTKAGADCSGTVWGIYNATKFKFAFPTIPKGKPRSSVFPEVKNFKPSPGNKPQPGDVAWWSGHMAIYDPDAGMTPSKEKGNLWSAYREGKKFAPARLEYFSKYGPVKWFRYDKSDNQSCP